MNRLDDNLITAIFSFLKKKDTIHDMHRQVEKYRKENKNKKPVMSVMQKIRTVHPNNK